MKCRHCGRELGNRWKMIIWSLKYFSDHYEEFIILPLHQSANIIQRIYCEEYNMKHL